MMVVSRCMLITLTLLMFVACDIVDKLVSNVDKLVSNVDIKFLVTVNDTWGLCIDTVATPFLKSGRSYNETVPIKVGDCDNGPLTFLIQNGSKESGSTMVVNLTFYSSVIEDASPPNCLIPWNGTYINPKTQQPIESPLPGCFVSDSREGWHNTFYWFRLLEWVFY